MAAALGLSLSLLVTVALLGWLAVEAERPAAGQARRGRAKRA